MCAEVGWWRWKGFLMESRNLRELPPLRFTLFPVSLKGRAVDLREAPLKRDAKVWKSRDSYVGTQALARTARSAGVGVILYESVRDPLHGTNAAVLVPKAFGALAMTKAQTWTLLTSQDGAKWIRDGKEALAFSARQWV